MDCLRKMGACATIAAVMLINFVPLGDVAAGATEKVLHSFTGGDDGGNPLSTPIIDRAGSLYGTTFYGGQNGAGTAYEINHGVQTVFFNFCDACNQGQEPSGTLLFGRTGNLYGTTQMAGDGGGVVFSLSQAGSETILYTFCAKRNCNDGSVPQAGLIPDGDGGFFGTTEGGGGYIQGVNCDCGTVFRLSRHGKEEVLHRFGRDNDGANPQAPLTIDADGNMYGTTLRGGSVGGGTVFKISADGKETILHNFVSGDDGLSPNGGLIMDESGNLYGVTAAGGSDNGGGTVYKVAPNGMVTILHAFCSTSGSCPDGAVPFGELLRDADGNLYGTTAGGGRKNSDCPQVRCGIVYKLSPAGTETILHEFCPKKGCRDGANPFTGLVADKNFHHLFGTTFYGGIYGNGTVFVVTQ